MWRLALSLLLALTTAFGAVNAAAAGAAGDGPAPPQSTSFFVDGGNSPGAGVRAQSAGGSSSSAGSDATSSGSGGGGAGVGRARRCSVYPRVAPALPTADLPQSPVGSEGMVAGGPYVMECVYLDDGSIALRSEFDHNPGVPGGGIDVAALARQVYEQVPLAFPQAHSAPPPDAQLVGFPVWLWLDDTSWRDFDASAGLAGITVTVTARPKHARWNLGDGTTITCGQGTAWTADSAAERSDCDHVYQYVSDRQPTGRYDARVTMVWSVSWSASTGQSGTLPDASRSTSFAMDVGERQAVITYGG